jgi:ABC-2 type transport system ATP-binding protein
MVRMSTLALAARGLTKSFGRRQVVRGVDLEVRSGEIVGFLGPNGAGKTTVMKMITGLLTPDAGEIDLLGVRNGFRDPRIRARIGYLQEKPRVYPEMSARGYLSLFAHLYGLADGGAQIGRALARVGLSDVGAKPVGAFSRGMQQRLCLARCLIHAPEFLVLDEPTLGLDPNGVIDMREIFLDLRASGVALLFSSHQLDEMERVTDRIVFLQDGQVLASGDKNDVLAGDASGGLLVETAERAAAVVGQVKSLRQVADAQVRSDHELAVTLVHPIEADEREGRAEFVRMLVAAGITPLSVKRRQISLEELFVQMTAGATSGARVKDRVVN